MDDRLASTTSETTTFGLLAPRLGLELAGVANDSFVIGVHGGMTLTNFGAANTLAWSALPFVELVLLPESFARPFFRVTLGATGEERTEILDGWAGATAVTTQTTLFTIGGAIGAHLFASGDVSFGPYFMGVYRVGGLKGAVVFEPAQQLHTDGFEVSLGVSLAYWAGGTRAAQLEEEASAPERSSPPGWGGIRLDRGTLELAHQNGRDVVARFRSRPMEDGRDIEIELYQPARATATQCSVATVTSAAGAPTLAASTQRDVTAGHDVITVRGSPDQLDLLTARSSVIDVCGRTLSFDVQMRASLINYLARFRALARQYGTYGRAELLPASAPPAQEVEPAPVEAPAPTATESEEAPSAE